MENGTGPYCIIYTSRLCLSSKRFMENYDVVTTNIQSKYPNINIVHIESKHFHGKFNENKYPSYIVRYANKFPNLILIPAPLWNISLQHRECGSKVKLIKGVSSFASTRKSPSINNICNWLSDTIDQDFIRLNTMTTDDFLNTYYSDIFDQTNPNSESTPTPEPIVENSWFSFSNYCKIT